MKKTGILNAPISTVISSMGHTDILCIADAGLPIPPSTQRIDLALKPGIPGFITVLDAVLEELEVESITLAGEIKVFNPEMEKEIRRRFEPDRITYISHQEFKEMTRHAKGVVRTGECTPYANIILSSGVVF